MSDKLGPLQYEEAQGETFLGYSQTQRHNMSNETALLIDAEIRRLVDGGHARATEIISTNVDQLHALAGALLELETLTGDEIKSIIGGGKIDRAADVPAALPSAGSSIPKAKRPKPGIGGAAPAGA
jgi:cell division protease FtsH